jgi:hypothetical protein
MATWLSRCVPGFCTLLLVTLLVLAFCDVELPSPILQWGESPRPDIPRQAVAHPEPAQRRVKLSQKLFIYYYLFVHADTVGFALRLCLSIVLVKRKLKATLRRRHDPPSSFSSESDSDSLPLDYVQLDPHHSHLFPGSSDPKLEEVIHAIIVPNYEEDIDTLRTTLAVLASHPRAATQYEVCRSLFSFVSVQPLLD